MLNEFQRYQKGLTLIILFPQEDKRLCACGCGAKLSARKKRWASKECQDFAVTTFFIVKGDTSIIRKELFKRDKAVCSCCGKKSSKWEADHILPVYLGGGACDLDNFQTLCKKCHSFKSRLHQRVSHQRAISSQADDMCVIRLLKDLGAVPIDLPKVSTEIHNGKCTFSSSAAI